MRLEQRIGRVDRIGQQRAVHALYLIGRTTKEPQMLRRLQLRLTQARADVGGPDPLGTDGNGAASEGSPPSAAALSFAQEAVDEASRIGAARILLQAGDQQALERPESNGPAVATSRRWKTRAALGDRTLMLWRAAALDATGRCAASTIVPLAVDRRSIDRLKGSIGAQVEKAVAGWRRDLTLAHRAFVATRLVREQHISGLRLAIAPAFQPGLFDRRVEQTQMAIAAAERDSRDDCASRLSALERARELAPTVPQLLLVLTTP
jgi:hypothetical protein